MSAVNDEQGSCALDQCFCLTTRDTLLTPFHPLSVTNWQPFLESTCDTLSAAYDRLDLLEWLIVTKEMDIHCMDGQRRSVLDIAISSKASSTTKWIEEWQAKRIISSFMQRNHHRLLKVGKQQREYKAATLIQKIYRGRIVFKLYSGVLSHRLEESQCFSTIWGHLIKSNVKDLKTLSWNWSSIRERVSDIKQAEFTYDDSYFEETNEHLSKALEGALEVNDECICNDNSSTVEELVTETNALDISDGKVANAVSWLAFQMTRYVDILLGTIVQFPIHFLSYTLLGTSSATLSSSSGRVIQSTNHSLSEGWSSSQTEIVVVSSKSVSRAHSQQFTKHTWVSTDDFGLLNILKHVNSQLFISPFSFRTKIRVSYFMDRRGK